MERDDHTRQQIHTLMPLNGTSTYETEAIQKMKQNKKQIEDMRNECGCVVCTTL